MRKTVYIVTLLSFLLSLLLIMDVGSSEYENKEALQMYAVENALTSIQKSQEERKNHESNNERNIASTTNNEEFEELMDSDDTEPLFEQIDKFEQ